MSPNPSRPRRARSSLLVGLALSVLLGAGACVPTGERPELVDEFLDDLPDEALACPGPGDPFAGFGAAEITLLGPDDLAEARCVLVADTPDLRRQGLMAVDDLAGYDGMIFSFPDDTTGSFWMGNTVLPLTIAFVDSSGAVVSTADMEPCPDAVDCTFYPPDGPYRWALEVPQGELDTFGLVDGRRLDPDTLPLARDGAM